MDPEANPGQVLAGRYRLGPLLGRGGMAMVFDGFDERLGRPVAIKVLRQDVAATPGVRERFEQEARAAARLSHPCVVSIFDTGEDRGEAFLVMERLPGETLADRIAQGPADQRWLVSVATDVLSALVAAHSLGLVHRDIKPGNVLLTAAGRAKVADFGIAKTMDGLAATDPGTLPSLDLTATGLVIGTPAYLAPERVEGRPATAQSDLYAVGVMLYEGLTGIKPFSGPNPLQVVRQAQAGSLVDVATLRPDVDPGLAAVVRRAMARRPEDRYLSARAMADDLHQPAGAATQVLPVGPGPAAGAGVGGTRVMRQPPPALPGPTPIPPPSPGSQRTVVIAVLVAIIVVVGVVALLLARSGSQGKSPATPATTLPAVTVTSPAVTTPTTTATTATTAPPTTEASTTTSSSTTTSTTATTTTTTTSPPSSATSPTSSPSAAAPPAAGLVAIGPGPVTVVGGLAALARHE